MTLQSGIPVFGAAPPGVACRPRRAAYAVIRDAQGSVAAIRALDRERGGYWLPGGGMEDGETPEETVRREVREELGRGVRPGRTIGDALQYFLAGQDGSWYAMTATFLEAAFDDKPVGAGAHELHWLDPGQAADRFLHACHAWAVSRQDPWTIRVDDLRGPEVAALLQEHLAAMARHSPPGSVHALDLAALRAPGITFWTVWRGTELAGCGALKELDPTHGELKSMRTAAAFLRQGVAAALLDHVLAVARERGYRRLSLETGSGPAFEPAHALYARHGFVRCGPFADYHLDAFSVFMTREIAPG